MWLLYNSGSNPRVLLCFYDGSLENSAIAVLFCSSQVAQRCVLVLVDSGKTLFARDVISHKIRYLLAPEADPYNVQRAMPGTSWP